jgi:hypothetical protein
MLDRATAGHFVSCTGNGNLSWAPGVALVRRPG